MIIERTVSPLYAVNTYYVINNNHIILIDPIEPLQFQNYGHSISFDFGILTHEHYDHICCVNKLRKRYDFPFMCSEKAKHGLEDPIVNMSRYADYLKQLVPFGTGETCSCDYSCQADYYLKNEERIDWHGHTFIIKETPGHSLGSISILLDDTYLFSGDTIFKDYPTATRMPGGSTKAFKQVTEAWLDSLPQDIVVYPGHTNPFRLSERYHKSH